MAKSRKTNTTHAIHMYIPSRRVRQEMQSEDASFWIVPANDGNELAFIIKAPSSAIKALIAGCPLKVLFGKSGPYLSAGVQILDMPDAPILISGAQREPEEHESLKRFLTERQTPVFLFNEMDVCLAWTNLRISQDDASQVNALINTGPEAYSGEFTQECSLALDCFCFSVDPSCVAENTTRIPLAILNSELESWNSTEVSFIGNHTSESISINNQNEGDIFEKMIWACLESVFPITIYRGPQVEIGEKLREFTDVLAFHKYGSFLIEAKDLSVIQAGYERDQARRTAGVQKQVKKAIVQLVGACKALMRANRVFAATGEELVVVRDQPAHCIVLVTELMNWGDWSEIEEALINAMRSTNSFFNLLDLRELITIIKASSGDARRLDYYLMERCKQFIDCGSVHFRSRIVPPSAT